MREVYNLKICTLDNDDNIVYKDFFLDVREIKGFFIPIMDEEDENDRPSINLFIGSESVSVAQEDHITDYLWQNFGKVAKEAQ